MQAARWSVLEALVNLALWVTFATIKTRAFAGKAPLYTGDKRVWATIAEAPFFSREFLLPRRPIVYPLLFKAGLSDPAIVSLQLWLSIVSWGLFAYALSRFVPKLIGPIVFAATLFFALVTPVNAWDLIIRSESTSHSLVVLTMASALLFCRALTQGRRRAIALAALTVLVGTASVFARDTNPFIVLLLLPTLGMWVWSVRRESRVTRRTLLTLTISVAVALSAASYTAQWTARAAPRFDFPLMNVIFTRVLPNPVKRDYFVRELGMPMSHALMSRKGRFASANGRRAYVDPALHTFRLWVFIEGYSAYQRYLLTHLEEASREALSEFPRVAGYSPGREGVHSATSVTPLADEWLVLGVLARSPLEACGVFFGIGLLAAILRWTKTRVLGALLVFLVLATLSQLFLCVHGDSMELYRHAVSVGILLRFALLVGVAIGASWLVSLVGVSAAWGRRRLAARRNAVEPPKAPGPATP
ncbi:MAG TPA: hypothetical protein VFQ35_14745 [Polyangiaceae bacterium]|nr:hypothetical protein [Polyangiaceae bacterium]